MSSSCFRLVKQDFLLQIVLESHKILYYKATLAHHSPTHVVVGA